LELIELSNDLKPLVEIGKYESVNKALIAYYRSKNTEITEFHSFHHWILQGFKVKKGEKGYAIWTKPIPKKGSAEQPNPEKTDNDESNYNVFGMCYVFSNLQVEKM
jgi:hypothetical protein